jgi:integrase
MERKRKTNRKSQSGNRFTSDYIDYDKASLKGNELLWSEKHSIIGFYIIFSINTGLRVSDVLARKHSDISPLRVGDYLRVTEKKTRKIREIQINKKIIDAYKYFTSKTEYTPDDFIFRSRKGTVYAIESLNTILKEVFRGYAEHVSSHSLRKSFGRHVYDINNQSEHALMALSEMFQHSSMAMTRKYLGIRREELGNIYMNL